MSNSSFDVIIVGQGLAGTALAWALTWSGARVLVIDRDVPGTASQVAAGLITPITGQRLVPSWRLSEFWSAAVEFYRRVELVTGATFFRETPLIRLLVDDTERDRLTQRLADAQFRTLVRAPPEHPLNEAAFTRSMAAFEMLVGGQLNVPVYLQASRMELQQRDGFLVADLDPAQDLDLTGAQIRLPRYGVSAAKLVFCQGLGAQSNPWFRAVSFKPAKGEVLTLRIPGLVESRIIHRGVWLAPAGGDLYRTGATYEWKQLDNQPTPAGREEILGRLREFLRLPFEVVDHVAAVRPIHRNQYPVMGLHPDEPRFGFFNGLGSKGALHAPYLSQHFAKVLSGDESLDAELDVNLRTDLRGCRP